MHFETVEEAKSWREEPTTICILVLYVAMVIQCEHALQFMRDLRARGSNSACRVSIKICTWDGMRGGQEDIVVLVYPPKIEDMTPWLFAARRQTVAWSCYYRKLWVAEPDDLNDTPTHGTAEIRSTLHVV